MNKPRQSSTPTASTVSQASVPTNGSPLRKRSLILNGHATSLALEDAFWLSLQRWAAQEQRTVRDLVAEIDAARADGSLASAVRVALLLRAEERARQRPHTRTER